MNLVSKIELTYELGAQNDDLGKEGLVHFVEHCMLKIKIDNINMISLINQHGGNINASTSIETLKINIQVSSIYLKNVIRDLIIHINKFKKIEKIDLYFFNNEKNIIIEEQKKKYTENRILGNTRTISNIKQEDIIAILKHLKEYLLCVYIDNVKNDEYMFVKHEMHNFLNDRSSVKKRIKEPKLYIKVIEKQFYDFEDGNVYYFGSNKYKYIENSSMPFMCVSISNNEIMRNNLLQTASIIREYLNSEFSNININIDYEIGIISIMFKGRRQDLLNIMKYLINFEGNVLPDNINYKLTQHILKELNDEFLNIHMESNINLYREINDSLKQYLRNHIAIVTNWNCYRDIYKILSQEKIGVQDFPLFNKSHFDIKVQKRVSNREKLLVWKGERYLSKNMYLSHIMWILIDGITGRLYEKLCIENSCCYTFKFYFRELYDTGYAVLYLISDLNQDKIQILFKEVLNNLNKNIDHKDLENAKKHLILAKGLNNENKRNIINSSCKLLIDKHANNSIGYIEHIDEISLDEVKTYIYDFMERDILQ